MNVSTAINYEFVGVGLGNYTSSASDIKAFVCDALRVNERHAEVALVGNEIVVTVKHWLAYEENRAEVLAFINKQLPNLKVKIVQGDHGDC